jgi:tetratricopeptide (TPR) repeat protein
MRKKLFPLLIFTLFQAGCAESPVYQKPAPVHRSRPPLARQEAPKTLETYQYPEESITSKRPPVEAIPQDEPAPISAIEPITPPDTPIQPEPASPPAAETSAEQPPAAEPEPPALPPISMASFSPPILALATEADQNMQAGQYDAAVVKIERALRIDPRNAVLTYKLASIRLKQEQPRLAEDLAKKAALLAGSDRDIKKRSWLLIAESKRLQNDPEGAEKAQQKALQF